MPLKAPIAHAWATAVLGMELCPYAEYNVCRTKTAWRLLATGADTHRNMQRKAKLIKSI